MPKSKRENGSSGSQPVKKVTRIRIRRPASASSTQVATDQKPSQLLTLSVDIFTEVCTRMTPLDLLKLSRTSKQLRAILLNVTNRYMWVLSRKYHGIPDPKDPKAPETSTKHDGSKEVKESVEPNEVSEPYYASLLFEAGCQNPGCESPECPIWDSDWKYLVRYCESCSPLFEITEGGIRNEWEGTRVLDSLLSCVPWDPSRSGAESPPTCLRTTFEDTKEQFLAAQPHTQPEVEEFRLGIQLEFDNRQKRAQEIALWVSDAEKSGVLYHRIRRRLLGDGCDLNKPYFSGFIDFSDNNPDLSYWNECVRRTRQLTLTEWRATILPALKSSLIEYKTSVIADDLFHASPNYVWKYRLVGSKRHLIPPNRNYYTAEWE